MVDVEQKEGERLMEVPELVEGFPHALGEMPPVAESGERIGQGFEKKLAVGGFELLTGLLPFFFRILPVQFGLNLERKQFDEFDDLVSLESAGPGLFEEEGDMAGQPLFGIEQRNPDEGFVAGVPGAFKPAVDPVVDINRLTFLRDPVMSLLIFDLDDFKTINDTYGHNAGDEVLRKIANGVRTLIRKVDLFSRFGGDEFIILMPGLEIAQAKFVAERIRSHIAKLPVLVGSGSVNITASFGLTGTYVDGAQKMDDLLELADSALYQAKNQGKNQICVTNPIP